MILSQTTETFGVEDQSWLGSAHGTSSARSITLDTSAFTEGTHYPDGYFKSGLALGKIASSGLYGPYAGRANEVQSVTLTGVPTGGTFTLTFDGETTAAIAYNAAASAVQTALEALSSINPGDVTVTGDAGGPWTVTFGGQYLGVNVPTMTKDETSLTGGTSPDVAVAVVTAGGSTASDGRQTLAGFLFCTVKAPSVNTIDVPAALLDHCRVIAAKLPIAVDAPGKADVSGRIIFV